jgi:hypothetical protein
MSEAKPINLFRKWGLKELRAPIDKLRMIRRDRWIA